MERPNILVLYTDQQRWDALGANGNEIIRTPNLDELASDGLNYDRFFVQNPVCMPSRYSFLTGRYCSSLRVFTNGIPVPSDACSLPRMLANHGYTSANIGKLHFLPHANRDHRGIHPAYGFDHLEISDEPGCYEDAYRAWVRAKDPAQLPLISVGLPPAAELWEHLVRRGDGVEHPAERFPKRALAFRGDRAFTHTAFVAEQTIEFIRRGSSRTPFLCIAGFYSPHSPWVAPAEFLDLYDPRELPLPEFPPELDRRRGDDAFSDGELRSAMHGYYAMVSEVDHHVGRILASLAECGLAENTIVVFTSDHGEFLGEGLRYGKGYPAPDCISRVPLILRWPRGIDDPGRTIHHLVEAVDVVPTLLDWAGIPPPRHLQGCALPSAPGAGPIRGSALTEMEGARSLRTERFRYVAHADGRETLFDLGAPYGGLRDVAGGEAYRATLAELRLALITRLLAMARQSPLTVQY